MKNSKWQWFRNSLQVNIEVNVVAKRRDSFSYWYINRYSDEVVSLAASKSTCNHSSHCILVRGGLRVVKLPRGVLVVQIYQRCMVSDDTPIPRFYNPTMSANLDDNEHHPLPAT